MLGSPLYGSLLRHAAADLLAGGPTADVLEGSLGKLPEPELTHEFF